MNSDTAGDNDIVQFSDSSEAISERLQDWVAMTSDEGSLKHDRYNC